MNEDELLGAIEDIVGAMDDGLCTTGQCSNKLLKLFMEANKPAIKTREHFQLFIYRVSCLRGEQKKYDAGDYKAKIVAKRMEVTVDNAINKLVNELGYNLGEITKKYEQQKLL